MKATLLLCEAAQTVDGKLYILGGGLHDLHAPIVAVALAGTLSFDANEINVEHRWTLRLVDQASRPVALLDETGAAQAVQVEGTAQVTPDGAVDSAAVFPCTIAVTFMNLGLADGHYAWEVEINGASDPSWRVPFRVHSHHEQPRPLWNDPLLPR